MARRPPRRYSDLAAARRRFRPFCEELLEDTIIDNSVPVQRCPACAAMWLNRNDLARIRRRARLAGFDEARVRYLTLPGARLVCPRCDVRELRRILTPAGVLHRCCGCEGFMIRDLDQALKPLLISAPLVRREDGSLEFAEEARIVVWVLMSAYAIAVVLVAVLWHTLFER